MIRIGYERYAYDCCVYVKSLNDDSFIYLLLYMDDILTVAKSMSKVNKLKILLIWEFDMKDLGTVKKILGWRFAKIELLGDYGYLSVAMLRKCWKGST